MNLPFQDKRMHAGAVRQNIFFFFFLLSLMHLLCDNYSTMNVYVTRLHKRLMGVFRDDDFQLSTLASNRNFNSLFWNPCQLAAPSVSWIKVKKWLQFNEVNCLKNLPLKWDASGAPKMSPLCRYPDYQKEFT